MNTANISPRPTSLWPRWAPRTTRPPGATRRAGAMPFGALILVSCGPALPGAPPTSEETCSGRFAGDLVVSELMPDPTGVDTGRQYVELYAPTDSGIDLRAVTLFYTASGATFEKRVSLPAATVPARGYLALADLPPDTNPLPVGIGAGYGRGLGALRHSGGTIGLRCGDELIDEVSYLGAEAGRALELDGISPPDAASNDEAASWCSATTPRDPLDPDNNEFGTPGAPNGVCGAAPVTRCRDASTGELRDAVTPDEGDLVISEVMPAPAAVVDAAGEWIEVYARASVDLNGLVLSAGSPVTVSAPSCLRVEAGSHALLARTPDPLLNGGLPTVSASLEFRLSNEGSTLELWSGDTLVDAFVWSWTRSGTAWQLSPDALGAPPAVRAGAMCTATASYGDGDSGTPGAPNTPCPLLLQAGECIDEQSGQARLIERPRSGDLFVSEIMAHPAAVPDAVGEWFEVVARREVDLDGLELANAGTGHTTLAFPFCTRVEPGGRALFARSAEAETNGGLPPVDATFSFALANTGPQAIVLRSGEEVVERAEYEGASSGVSLQLALDGSTDVEGAVMWCVTPAEQIFGNGDRGSPGAANVACDGAAGAAPTEAAAGAGGTSAEEDGRCRDHESGATRDLVAPQAGDLVLSEVMAAPTSGNNGPGEWFEVLAVAAVDLNGLELQNQSGKSLRLSSPDCMSARAGDWLLFARSADAALNGGLPPLSATFDFALADSSSDAYPERALMLSFEGREFDRVTWTASEKGVSLQLSSAALASPASDVPERWCAAPAAAVFGSTDRGTPAGVNLPCP